jgi:Flp pilus assembly protein TadG
MLRFMGSNARLGARSATQSGQTLALIVVFMMSLLGVSALAIDVGSWYQAKRHLQADADAAALAAAASIPVGSTAASLAATANFAKNQLVGETMTFATPASDSVRVTTSYAAPTYLAKLFGKRSATITASATAQIQALGSASHHVSPYVVTETSYNNGQGTTLFNCDANGNCGTVDLPTAANTSGGSCSGTVYSGTSQNVIAAITDQIDIGEVDVRGCLSPKTGSAQPSGNAVNQLAGSIAQDLQSLGNGQYQVIHQSWDDAQGLPPRLIFVPIVAAFGQGTNANMTVEAFAWFYITSATGNGQTLAINGQYVSMSIPPSGKTIAWQPGKTGQITTIALTG